MSNKRFLITGCNGYIGTHLASELRNQFNNSFIVGVDRNYREETLYLFDKFYDLNICDLKELSLKQRQSKFDCVFHLAGSTLVRESETKPLLYYHNNVVGLINLISHVTTFEYKNIVFASTCSVYGIPQFLPINEDHPLNPISVYSKTKKMSEDILKDCEERGVIKAAILRFANPAGCFINKTIYKKIMNNSHIMPQLATKNEFKIFGNNLETKDGTCMRDYIHIKDLCGAIIKSYQYLEKKDKGIICNLGSGNSYTVKEIIDMAKIVFNKDIKIIYEEANHNEPPKFVADIYKMQSELEYVTQYTMKDILESMRGL